MILLASIMATLLVLATTLAFAVGGLAGMLSGYVGGVADAIGSRVIDILLSLPPLLIVLVVIAALGSSNTVLVLSVAIVYSPRVARILRGATQGIAAREYVQAAQARGERALGIVLRELLPNILPTVFVEFAVRLTYVIIFVATLNFLGLGLAPPSPNWGVMVAESRPTVLIAPVTTLAPALAIGIVSVGISLVADAVTQRLGLEGESEFLR
jgi:peptide/nickel transport system permease protein